jgi:hypothetical protein
MFIGSQQAGTWSLNNNKLRLDVGYGYVDYDVTIKNDEAQIKADMKDYYAEEAADYGLTLKKATVELVFRRI